MELAEIPSRNLADHIVEGRFEECRGHFGHRVAQVEQSEAEAELGGHECQGIAGGFRSESRRAAQTGVDLDHAVVHRIGVEGILHVAFADDAYMAHDLDGEFAQIVVVLVRQGLRGSHHDRFAGVDAERIEILHVADRYAVVEAVADHFVFHFLPSFERFLHQHLWRERQSFFCQLDQLSLVVAEAAAKTAQSVGRAYYHRESEPTGGFQCALNVVDGLAFDRFHSDLVELTDK